LFAERVFESHKERRELEFQGNLFVVRFGLLNPVKIDRKTPVEVGAYFEI